MIRYAKYVVLVFLVAVPACFSGHPAMAAGTLRVGTGAGCFSGIQDAIDAAEDGTIIAIDEGAYRENLTIDRPVTLLGGGGVRLIPEDVARPAIAIGDTEGVTVSGLRIEEAKVGIDISGSPCMIADCSIGASEVGIAVLLSDGDAVTILDTVVRDERTGIGATVLGAGSVLFTRCTFRRLATGLLIGGLGMTGLQACELEGCYEAVVASATATVLLAQCGVHDSYANAIRLERGPFPADDGALLAIDCVIEDSGGWGITLCGLDGIPPDAPFGRIGGFGNVFAGNGRGIICPAAFELPEGFVAE